MEHEEEMRVQGVTGVVEKMKALSFSNVLKSSKKKGMVLPKPVVLYSQSLLRHTRELLEKPVDDHIYFDYSNHIKLVTHFFKSDLLACIDPKYLKKYDVLAEIGAWTFVRECYGGCERSSLSFIEELRKIEGLLQGLVNSY